MRDETVLSETRPEAGARTVPPVAMSSVVLRQDLLILPGWSILRPSMSWYLKEAKHQVKIENHDHLVGEGAELERLLQLAARVLFEDPSFGTRPQSDPSCSWYVGSLRCRHRSTPPRNHPGLQPTHRGRPNPSARPAPHRPIGPTSGGGESRSRATISLMRTPACKATSAMARSRGEAVAWTARRYRS